MYGAFITVYSVAILRLLEGEPVIDLRTDS